MKGFAKVLALAVAALVMVLVMLGVGFFFGRSTVKNPPAPPPVISLEDVADLVATRMHVADVVPYSKGKYKGVLLVKGDAELTVDMQRIDVKCDPLAKRALIRLPPIQVKMARVDHDHTSIWSVELNSWKNLLVQQSKEEFLDDAFGVAQLRITQMANMPDAHRQARQSAERTLKAFVKALGYEAVIEWEK